METPYVPHEVIASNILPRLPVRSLQRFSRVCKAWRATIASESFVRAHLRHLHDPLSVLIVPQVKRPLSSRQEVTTAFYTWDRGESQRQGATTLVHAEHVHHTFPPSEAPHDTPHCDGLVLMSSNYVVCVLNPATRRFRTLPWSRAELRPHGRRLPGHFKDHHQAFGLGHDPRSGRYKVARFYYRSFDLDMSGDYRQNLGMEVFTIGVDYRNWRETAEPPPYPIMPTRAATFFKGSLLWTIKESLIPGDVPGFIRLRLEDESFSIMSPPPCSPRPFDYTASSLAELRGELCVAHPTCNHESLEMWMCGDLDGNPPQWDRRYVIPGLRSYHMSYLRPVAMFEDEIVFQVGDYYLLRYDIRSGEGVIKGEVWMENLRYRNPGENNKGMLVRYTRETGYAFDAIPYVPSLVRDGLVLFLSP